MKKVLWLLIMSITLIANEVNDLNKGMESYQKGDYIAAYKIWKPLAEKGDSKAQYYIGFMYENANGIARDRKEAFKWYLKAAEQNMPKAQETVALAYMFGHGLTGINFEKGLYWGKKAAEQDQKMATYYVGWVYEFGKGNIKADFEQAFYWYEKAAKIGQEAAQGNVAEMYYNGNGVARDYAKAFYWFKKASETSKDNDAYSMYKVAYMYERGEGVAKDSSKARSWYKKAAKAGSPQAQAWLKK